jgi:hypothetical protein
MSTVRISWLVALSLSFALPGCKSDSDAGKDADAKDAKDDGKEAKAEAEAEDAGSLKVATGDEGAEGPVPPETSMVFFSVEGALLPLACFDKAGGKVLSGTKCLDLVPAGAQGRLSSIDSQFNKPIGERTEPQCTAGDGAKTAFAVEGITEGANFKFGAWPPSALKVVTPILDDTMEGESIQIGDDEKAKLVAASGKTGELTVHQVAEFDLDGNGKKDKSYSVYMPDPKVIEQYAFSAMFVAPDGNLDALIEIDRSKSRKDVYEIKGVLDLDGDGTQELWVRQVFTEGSGDRIVKVAGGKVSAIGNYSCGG